MENFIRTVKRSAPAIVSLGAGIAVLLVHHASVFFPSWSDENIHLYVASRVADGATLYGDIHSARPPLALLPLIFLFRMDASPLLAARATNVLAEVATALIVLWCGWRLWGRSAGAVGAFLMLSTPAVASRCSFTGINLVSADLADLAPRWIKTGAVQRADVVARIEADQVEHFITPAWFYVHDPFFRGYLHRCYGEPTVYPREEGSGIPRILVFRHRPVPRPCLPDAEPTKMSQPKSMERL